MSCSCFTKYTRWQGIVTLQALSSGCPIIVSENTGPVEIIKKYNCGMIVPIRSSVAIMNVYKNFPMTKIN